LAIVIIYNTFGAVTDGISSVFAEFLNGSEKKEALKDVPEEFRENYFFKAYNLGSCESLVGDVCVTMVFVDDDKSKWTDQDIAEFKKETENVLVNIESDAKKRGVKLNLSTKYLSAQSSGELSLKNYMDWVKKAIASAGLPEFSKIGAKLEKNYGVDNAPVIFCVNRDGRCFAKPSSTKRNGEFAILYEDTNSFYHEFCHIFGAVDFYYPDDVKELAEKNLPDSIMNSGGKKVDDLTAYLIGWTKTLNDGATKFLRGTNHITADYMSKQHADETYTGYVSGKLIGDTVYTGQLVDGILEGEGQKIRDGNIWKGTFKGGLLNGKGSYVTSDGDKYVGDFVDGKRQGKGTYVWKEGDSYTGDYFDGQMHGKGTLKWVSGDVYIGDFVKGVCSGQGTYKWKNGDVYVGSFKEGKRTGQGTYKWHNGDVYVGEFLDGKLHGYGTLTYANGKVRKGTWASGKFVG
jgi:hypothetical protein